MVILRMFPQLENQHGTGSDSFAARIMFQPSLSHRDGHESDHRDGPLVGRDK
jgi:hypothetical protein